MAQQNVIGKNFSHCKILQKQIQNEIHNIKIEVVFNNCYFVPHIEHKIIKGEFMAITTKVRKTAEVKTRVEPKLKKESRKIFKKLGLSESEGVRLLLKGLVIHQGIPFEFKIPNKETVAAMEEVEKGIYSKGYKDVDEMFEDILNEKDASNK